MNEPSLTEHVVKHWVAWGPTADCPDELIEHDAKRAEQFDLWIADVKAQAWEQGYAAGDADAMTKSRLDRLNPFVKNR